MSHTWFRAPVVHELKCYPIYFGSAVDGTKTFEVRYDDRGFKVGDDLFLREFSPTEGYTGRTHRVRITYMFSGMGAEVNGVAEGYRVLGIKDVSGRYDSESAKRTTPAVDVEEPAAEAEPPRDAR